MLKKEQLKNKIINKNCLDILKNIEHNSVDLFFTSPPYADRRKNVYFGICANKYIDWFLPIAKEIKRTMSKKGSFFLNIKEHIENGQRHLYVKKLIISLVEELNFYFIDEFCWVKNGYPIGNKGRFKNAWEPIFHFTKQKSSEITFNPISCGTPITYINKRISKLPKNGSLMSSISSNRFNKLTKARPSNYVYINNISNQFSKKSLHPATFPVALPEFFIKSFSNENNLICDPFGGSGTTALACIKNKRDYLMIEKEKKYCDLISERISNDKISEDEIILQNYKYDTFTKLFSKE